VVVLSHGLVFFFFLAILENYDKAQELLEESAEAFQVQFKQR
jgi:hypothetical protein